MELGIRWSIVFSTLIVKNACEYLLGTLGYAFMAIREQQALCRIRNENINLGLEICIFMSKNIDTMPLKA